MATVKCPLGDRGHPTHKRKAMASTTLPDGMYYELTFSGNKRELYVDAYKKWQNFTVVV